ncbi:MAG: lipoprotein [Candidatus Hydrogenedentota bacterium]
MIVPRTLLLICVGGLIAISAVGVTVPAVAGVLHYAAIGLVAVAALDAMLGRGSLKGLGVSLPEVVRLSKDRDGEVDIYIRNDRARARPLRIGLAFPREIGSQLDSIQTVAPPDTAMAHVSWAVKPERRGNYHLDRVYMEGTSPLGFWAVRSSSPIQSELRVYPNLLTERRRLAALFLNRGAFGAHAQRQVGQGREFEKLREYVPGDGYEDIHWKATAKRGKPITKLFQIERTQEVYVVIDTSRLSARRVLASTGGDNGETVEVTQLERFITAALILGLVAERQGDLFGLVTYGDSVRSFVRASTGQAHYSNCRDALYTLEPQTVNPDFDELFTFLRMRLRRRALLVFLTNLEDAVLSESFVRNVEIIRKQHLVLVGMLSPPGIRPLFSDDSTKSVDDVYRSLAGHIRWRDLRELERVLHRQGVSFFLMDNERMCADLVGQYASVKQRQLL